MLGVNFEVICSEADAERMLAAQELAEAVILGRSPTALPPALHEHFDSVNAFMLAFDLPNQGGLGCTFEVHDGFVSFEDDRVTLHYLGELIRRCLLDTLPIPFEWSAESHGEPGVCMVFPHEAYFLNSSNVLDMLFEQGMRDAARLVAEDRV